METAEVLTVCCGRFVVWPQLVKDIMKRPTTTASFRGILVSSAKKKGPMVFTKRPFSLHLIFTWSAHLESNQGYPVICWKRVYKSRVLPLHYERIFGVVGGIRASNLPLQRGCSTVKLTRHKMVGHCGFDPHSPAFQAGAITSSADAPYKSQPLPGKICFRPYASTHIRCSVDPHLNKKCFIFIDHRA